MTTSLDTSKVAVAGCAGFIGQHVTRHLLNVGQVVVGADNFCEDLYPASQRRNAMQQLSLNPNFHFTEVDLLEHVPNEFGQCAVHINMAGLAGQQRSWEIPEKYRRANVDLAVALFTSAQGSGARRFVHASTSSVYGEFAEGNETRALAPCSPYGETKVEAEGALQATSGQSTELVVLRFFSVYGPGQRPDMGFFRIIHAALRNEEVPVHDRVGLMRDFTYVSDVSEAVLAVMRPEVAPSIYNVASSEPTSLDDSLNIIEELTTGHMRRRLVPTPHGLQTRTSGITTKLRAATNWQPSTSLRDGIANQVDWQRDNNL